MMLTNVVDIAASNHNMLIFGNETGMKLTTQTFSFPMHLRRTKWHADIDLEKRCQNVASHFCRKTKHGNRDRVPTRSAPSHDIILPSNTAGGSGILRSLLRWTRNGSAGLAAFECIIINDVTICNINITSISIMFNSIIISSFKKKSALRLGHVKLLTRGCEDSPLSHTPTET